MLDIDEYLVAKSKITDLATLDDGSIIYSTQEDGINFISVNQPKQAILNEFLNSSTTAHSFSPNSLLFAFAQNQTLYILNIKSKKLIQTIQITNEEIEQICFDTSSKYIFIATKSARVLQFRHDCQFLISELHPFSPINSGSNTQNSINSFTLYKNSIAINHHNGTITIIDINSKMVKSTIIHNHLSTLSFIDENNIISADKNGEIHITSLDNSNSQRVIKTSFSSIKQIVILQNRDFAMIVGEAKFISILDIRSLKIEARKYIEFSANIIKIDISSDEILTALLQNNKIATLQLPNEKKLSSFIQCNRIKEAYELTANEPTLKESPSLRALEEKYLKRFLEAAKTLKKGDETKAKQILEIYRDVKSKSAQIKELFDAYKNYPRFCELYKEKRYSLLYATADRFPPLKETIEYAKMEQTFKTALLGAQKLLLKDDKNAAKALLSPYSTITSKKSIIKLVLTQNREFMEFLKAINERKYDKINQFITTYKHFKEIPSYVNLYNEIEKELLNIQNSIISGNLEDIDKQLRALEGVMEFKERVNKLTDEFKSAIKLQKAYKRDDFRLCYEILDRHNSLRKSELGALLEKHWSNLIDRCERFAMDGNVKDIKRTFDDLMSIKSRSDKINDLIKVGFYARVTELIKKRNFDGAEIIIYTYIDTFGYDNEIGKIMKSYEEVSVSKLAITQKNQFANCL